MGHLRDPFAETVLGILPGAASITGHRSLHQRRANSPENTDCWCSLYPAKVEGSTSAYLDGRVDRL